METYLVEAPRRMEIRGQTEMKRSILITLGLVLTFNLTDARAVEKAGMFQGESVEFAVKYYAGGVGYSPQEEAAEKSAEYSVRVVFATAERALLGDVGLVVTDAKGRVVFRIEKAEPLIYLALPKGIYDFEGRYHGASQRLERIGVDPARRREVVFRFPE